LAAYVAMLLESPIVVAGAVVVTLGVIAALILSSQW